MPKINIKEKKEPYFSPDNWKKEQPDKRKWRCPFAGLIGPDGAKYPRRRDVTR